jgi:hypothetical protein
MKLEPFYIVAGNKEQFDNFVIRKRIRGLCYDFLYVWNADVLRGLTKIRGFYIGDYEKHPDWMNIKEAIQIIKWKEKGVRDECDI